MDKNTPKIKIQTKTDRAGKARYTGLYQHPDGSWKSAGTHGSRRLAEKAAIGTWIECRKVDYVDPKKGEHTVKTQFESVFWPSKQHLAANTKSGYAALYRNWIDPYIGGLVMGSVGTSDIEGWVSQMVRDKPGQHTTIVAAHKLAFSVFKQALRARVVAFNPCDGTPNLPSVITPDVKVMTPEEFDLYLAALPEFAQDMVTVMIETGLRLGEFLGLSPSQIDRANKRLIINRSLAEVSSQYSPTGEYFHIKETKGKRTRYISISPEIMNILLSEVMKRGLSMDSTAVIFVNPATGNYWSRMDWRRSVVLPSMDQAGLTSLGYSTKHLRSSHASWLLAGGADLAVVKERLGHHSITVTERYLKALPDSQDAALDAFQSIRRRTKGA